MRKTIILLLLLVILFVSGCVFSKPDITEIKPLSILEFSWKTINYNEGQYTINSDDGRPIDVTGAEVVDYLELIIFNPNPFDVLSFIEGMNMKLKTNLYKSEQPDFIIKPGENRIIIQERNNNLTKYIVLQNDDKVTLTLTAVGIRCYPDEGCKMSGMNEMNEELKKYGGRVILRKVIDLPTLKNTSIIRRIWS